MRFHVVAVGKPRNPGLAAAIAEFEGRAKRYWPLEIVEVRQPSRGSGDDADVRRGEAEAIVRRLPPGTVVACDERGDRLSSREFASWLSSLRETATDVAFVVGGAFGLDQAIRDRAARLLSLAPWTLSHELARLVLAEQLYRAGTIVRGDPYHK